MKTLILLFILGFTINSQASELFNPDCQKNGYEALFIAKVGKIRKHRIDQMLYDCTYELKDFKVYQPNQLCRLEFSDLEKLSLEDNGCELTEGQDISGILVKYDLNHYDSYFMVKEKWVGEKK